MITTVCLYCKLVFDTLQLSSVNKDIESKSSGLTIIEYMKTLDCIFYNSVFNVYVEMQGGDNLRYQLLVLICFTQRDSSKKNKNWLCILSNQFLAQFMPET
jgi:hypothetical protein